MLLGFRGGCFVNYICRRIFLSGIKETYLSDCFRIRNQLVFPVLHLSALYMANSLEESQVHIDFFPRGIAVPEVLATSTPKR